MVLADCLPARCCCTDIEMIFSHNGLKGCSPSNSKIITQIGVVYSYLPLCYDKGEGKSDAIQTGPTINHLADHTQKGYPKFHLKSHFPVNE